MRQFDIDLNKDIQWRVVC